jgi:hypothetical protein
MYRFNLPTSVDRTHHVVIVVDAVDYLRNDIFWRDGPLQVITRN